ARIGVLELVGPERRERGEMRAGGGAEEADARSIELELAGAAAHELHGRANIGDRLRKHFLALLREAITDREQRITARGEIRSPILEGAARARLPSAAMGGHERGKRPGAHGQIKVARERNAVVSGVRDAGVCLDGW